MKDTVQHHLELLVPDPPVSMSTLSDGEVLHVNYAGQGIEIDQDEGVKQEHDATASQIIFNRAAPCTADSQCYMFYIASIVRYDR